MSGLEYLKHLGNLRKLGLFQTSHGHYNLQKLVQSLQRCIQLGVLKGYLRVEVYLF